MVIKFWSLTLTAVSVVTGGVMVDYEQDDEIMIHAENPRKKSKAGHQNPPASVKPVDAPVDPCLDLESVEFALGECSGPVVCRGSSAVSSTRLTESELRNLRANTARHGVIDEIQVNFCGSGPGGGGSSEPSMAQLVGQEWQRVSLPPAVISLEPADGLTLVNLGTYMQAEQDVFSERLHLLGRDVFLRAEPVMWHWDYGDGSDVVSEAHAGTYYPDPQGSHAYDRAGVYTVSVSIEWLGQYSIDGVEWLPIYGTGTTTSSAEIEVIEHRPRLETLKTT